MLTKDDAYAIAKKLGAQESREKNSPHIIQLIYQHNKLIAHFGIRHGSNRNAGHDHIPKNLHVSMHFCFELAHCTKYLNDWLLEMTRRGNL
jgi:hypothetical protein